MSKERVLERRKAKYLVSHTELRLALPHGLRRIFDRKGIPIEGTGKYSIPNERVRLSNEQRRTHP